MACSPTFLTGDSSCSDYYLLAQETLSVSYYDGTSDGHDTYDADNQEYDLNGDGIVDVKFDLQAQYSDGNPSAYLNTYRCIVLNSNFELAEEAGEVDAIDELIDLRTLSYGSSNAMLYEWRTWPNTSFTGNFSSGGYVGLREVDLTDTSFYWFYLPEYPDQLDSYTGWKQ